MSASIWLIAYGLQAKDEARYLTWFHEVHIPEKLARTGYTWASHYRSTAPVQLNDTESGHLFVAFFGGESSSILYNPSPVQLAPRQPAETREMMGCRIASKAFILSTEWTKGVDGLPADDAQPIHAPHMALSIADAGSDDMLYSSWLVQEHCPQCQGVAIYKLLASSGRPRHVSIYAGEDPARIPTAKDMVRRKDPWFSDLGDRLTFAYDHSIIAFERLD